jgi:hypothetical protein
MCTVGGVQLAGIPVQDRDVLHLAERLRDVGFDDTAQVLEHAWHAERRVVALTVPDREAILRVLDGAPDGYAELRGVLLREHVWRLENGL